MGDGRKRKVYRSLAGTLAMTLVIGTLGCGMPQAKDDGTDGEQIQETILSEESIVSSDESDPNASKAESVQETFAESKETKEEKKSNEPKEYVWDFDELVNADWRKEEKKDHPKGSTFVLDYTERMQEYFDDIVDNTDLDKLSKEDGLYKALYVYRQLIDYKKRGKSLNPSIKARLDRIDGVGSMEELYDLYADEEYSRYDRLLWTTPVFTGNGTYISVVMPRTLKDETTAMNGIEKNCMIVCLTNMGFDKIRAREIADNAMKIEKKIEQFWQPETSGDVYVSKKTLEQKEVSVPIIDILTKLNAITASNEFLALEEEYAFYREVFQPENFEALRDHMIVTAMYRLGAFADPETVESIMKVMWGCTEKDAYENNMKNLLAYIARDLIAIEYDRRFVSDHDIYAETEEMLEDVKASMRESFDYLEWAFPYDSKDFMDKKLDCLRVYVGRNGDYNDLSDVELSEDPIDNLAALLTSQERFTRKQLKRVLEDRTMTGHNMFENNAYYVPGLNSVMINSAWLSMYSDLKEQEQKGDGLQYEEKLAWLGSMLAHEIGHAYSPDVGLYYNYRGVNTGWMKDRESVQYDEYIDGITQFFDGMEVEFGYQLDGETVCDEAFADLMGIGCCLRILDKRKDSDYDLFFRSYARLWAANYTKNMMKSYVEDAHLPSKERINCVLAQFDAFYETYEIDENSPYYVAPEDRLKGFWQFK